ncbi:MAG: 1-acyl-sn-glycerol-3-phosphate acyltransferase [Caldilineaceae bacterium]
MQLFLQIRAAIRVALAALVIGLGAVLVLILSPLPWRIGGAKVATLPVKAMARAFIAIFGIDYQCPDHQKVSSHAGLIFCNHTSFLDIILILYHTPTRFLSTKGVRKLPFIGQIAVALDTVFVHRHKDDARAVARNEISAQLQKRLYPPLAIFPRAKSAPVTRCCRCATVPLILPRPKGLPFCPVPWSTSRWQLSPGTSVPIRSLPWRGNLACNGRSLPS